MDGGEARYWVKRQAGISPTRKDGSLTSAENDRQAAGAEHYAADYLGAKFNGGVFLGGDGGTDFDLNVAVEVIWLGFLRGTTTPRQSGHLIVNPDEPHRWATIYVVVSGSLDGGFEMCGWTTHARLCEYPKRDFGFGSKYAMPTRNLYPIETIRPGRRTNGDS